MYQVVAAHDLTARSDVALVRAARLAFDRKGHLTIIHVVDSDLPAHVVDAQRMRTENYLESGARQWLGNAIPSYRIEIVSGDPADTIAAEAEARAADLVVTGRHRRRPVADMFVGTTVERLLRLTRRPILVVNNPNQSPYQSVLIPVDFSDASTAAIRFAATFLPKANLHLFHAYKGAFQDYVAALSLTFSREERARFAGPIGEQAKQAMSRLIDTLRLGARGPSITIKNGDASALVEEELALQKTDLVVMGTHARSGIAHALIGSVAETVLSLSACDMLVVPVPEPSWSSAHQDLT